MNYIIVWINIDKKSTLIRDISSNRFYLLKGIHYGV